MLIFSADSENNLRFFGLVLSLPKKSKFSLKSSFFKENSVLQEMGVPKGKTKAILGLSSQNSENWNSAVRLTVKLSGHSLCFHNVRNKKSCKISYAELSSWVFFFIQIEDKKLVIL